MVTVFRSVIFFQFHIPFSQKSVLIFGNGDTYWQRIREVIALECKWLLLKSLHPVVSQLITHSVVLYAVKNEWRKVHNTSDHWVIRSSGAFVPLCHTRVHVCHITIMGNAGVIWRHINKIKCNWIWALRVYLAPLSWNGRWDFLSIFCRVEKIGN